jgi:hypothetical protein
VSIIERVLPADRAAKLLAAGLCFALANLALKLLIHGIWGEYGAWDFRAGALVGFFGATILGMFLAVPLAIAESGRVITLALTIVTLTYDAFAYSTYAETGHLPTVSSLFGYAASADVAFVLRGAGLGALASLGYGVGAARLEARLRVRMSSWGVRVADFATIALFALFGLGTLVAGSGPVYYGVIHPLVHLAAGRIQESPDPLPESANVHHHRHAHGDEHRHEHGFVPEEAREPFPADGIPRPAESMRLQYQGLLGSEAFTPIEDTAYPLCRREAEGAPLARPHEVIVLDLSGLSREMFDKALSALGAVPRPKVAFERIHAVSTDAKVGRRSLFTGLPPAVARRFVPDAPNLPSPPFLPRYPSIAASLESLGVRTAYFGPDPGIVGTERLELASLGFGTMSFGDERPAPSSARDLDTLARLGEFLDAKSTAPRFAFVELRSFGGEEKDPRVIAALEELIRTRGEASIVLTSDHVAQQDPAREGAELGVPFAVIGEGLPEDEALAGRLGSTYDLPQTVLGLLGSPKRFCHQGRNLLDLEAPFPARRVVFSQVGEGERAFVLTEVRDHEEGLLRWHIDASNPFASETPASLFDLEADPQRKNDLFSRKDPDWPQIDEFWKSHLAIGIYLLRTDRFTPQGGGEKPKTQPLAAGDEVSFAKVERVPAQAGRYLVPVQVFDRGDSLDEVLAAQTRGSTVVLDLRAGAFGTHQALETWLGKHARAVDGLLFDDVGMAIARAERSSRPVGVWLRPSMGDRGSLFELLSSAGIDFVVMPLATDSAVRRAKQRGLEVWVPRARAEALEDAKPNGIID